MIGKRKKEDRHKMDNTSAKAATDTSVADQETSGEATLTDNNTTGETNSPDQGIEGYAELNDKYLRLYSDFDNFRKRTLKEKVEISKYASAEVITKLLPVLDDFDRAIKALDAAAEAGQALKDGVVLIYNKFNGILLQQGLQPMRAIGESFDTDFHEAITNIPAPSPEQKGKIVDEIEKGYLLNGKVIRYAKVVVGS